jgi:hypothetical protein
MSAIAQLSNYAKISAEELKRLISGGLHDIRITQEDIWVAGSKRCIHRIHSVNTEYRDVGWVLDEDSNNCMICSKEFWLFVSKHHCRLCGNLICATCTESEVLVKELPLDGPQKACAMCYWGQQVSVSCPQTLHTTSRNQLRQLRNKNKL